MNLLNFLQECFILLHIWCVYWNDPFYFTVGFYYFKNDSPGTLQYLG